MAVIAGLSGYPGMRGAMNEPTVAHFLHWTCLVKGKQVGFMRCASSFQCLNLNSVEILTTTESDRMHGLPAKGYRLFMQPP